MVSFVAPSFFRLFEFSNRTSFEFGNGKDALQPKTISTKWYGNIPDSPDWVPGNVWKRNIRWFWDLDHHGEIASRKKIPTLRTGLRTVSSEIPGRTGGPGLVWSSSGKCVEEFGGTEWSMIFPGTASIRAPLTQPAG